MTATEMSEDQRAPQRRHGLHAPFDPLQGVALFAYVIFSLTMGLFHFPLMSQGGMVWQICLIVLILWIPLNVASYIIAAISPVHDFGLEHPVEEWELSYPKSGETSCYECMSHVSLDTKHCWSCNKCVVHFDHHCKWLNHCVGERNYKIFVIFLSNTCALMGTQLGLSYYVLHYAFKYSQDFARRCEIAYGPGRDAGAVKGFLIFCAVLETLAFLPLAQLAGLHIMLRCRGFTTYEYILLKREQKKQEQYAREALGMGSDPVFCHSYSVWKYKRAMAAKKDLAAGKSKMEYSPTSTRGDTSETPGGPSSSVTSGGGEDIPPPPVPVEVEGQYEFGNRSKPTVTMQSPIEEALDRHHFHSRSRRLSDSNGNGHLSTNGSPTTHHNGDAISEGNLTLRTMNGAFGDDHHSSVEGSMGDPAEYALPNEVPLEHQGDQPSGALSMDA